MFLGMGDLAGLLLAVYCRISEDPSGNLLGVTRQEAECRELAARRGGVVAEVFVDDDRSAFRKVVRPGFDALAVAMTDCHPLCHLVDLTIHDGCATMRR